jgi:hypothetical protein
LLPRWVWRWFRIDCVAPVQEFVILDEDALQTPRTDHSAGVFRPGLFPIREIFGSYDEPDHFPSPGLIELFVEVGQFAQKVGVAQAVATVGEGEVGSEAVVDEEDRQDLHALHRFTTTLGIKMVGGELIGAEDMEPISFAVAGAPCFIGMGDGAFNEGLLDGAEGLFSFLAASGDNVGECPFAEGSTEEVAKKFAQTAVGKELVVTQVEGGGLQARAVLSGSANRFRKGGGVGFAAVGAAATLCPVLGDFQGDRRKVKDLSCFKVIVMSGSTERLAALRTKL